MVQSGYVGIWWIMRRSQLTLLAFLVVGGCAWSHTYEVDIPLKARSEASTDALPVALRRCFGSAVSAATEATSMEVTRREARALRRVLEKVEAGETPTEAEYAQAGCREAGFVDP